jgi:hypothetical protein
MRPARLKVAAGLIIWGLNYNLQNGSHIDGTGLGNWILLCHGSGGNPDPVAQSGRDFKAN